MNTHFYNTVNLEGLALQIEEDKAKSQEKIILHIFKQFSEYSFRTYDIERIFTRHSIAFNHDALKRAINSLTKQGHLIKSEKATCPGPYHLKVNVWQYNKESKEKAA